MPPLIKADRPPAGPDLFGDGPLAVRVRAPARRRAARRFRERLLRNLAVANTREALRPHGLAGDGGSGGGRTDARSSRGGRSAAAGGPWDPAPAAWSPAPGPVPGHRRAKVR